MSQPLKKGAPAPSKAVNLFKGVSTLREEERKRENAPKVNAALQSYLQKYTGGADAGQDTAPGDYLVPKEKKKKKKKVQDGPAKIMIVDNDVSGMGGVRRMGPASDDEEDEEFQPVVVNQEEAKALARQIEQAKNYYGAKEDGRGWVQADVGAPSSAARAWHDSPGASPPRRGGRHDSPDASPPRRGARHDSPDASPPRRPRAGADLSPPRRGSRHDSPNASPPRQPRAGAILSPPRRTARHDSPDASPPRRPLPGRARHDSPDASPPRRPRAGADLSPPRRTARDDSQDASPPRRPRAGADILPPRRAGRHDSPDASPPRRPSQGRVRHDSPYASPPRKPQADSKSRMSDGTVAGLVSAKELADEAKEMQLAAAHRRANAVGRGAETIYRDRATGKLVSKEEFAEARRKGKKEKTKEEEEEEQFLEWRGGLAQKKAAEERAARMREEALRPFARGEDDAERDAIFKERTRFGDPMAHLVKKKARVVPGEAIGELTAQYNEEALKKSGFMIPQEIPPHSWLRRGVAAPSNRYNIRPGRHWDGVDRSNSFEKSFLLHQNQTAADKHEARMWSMEDM